MNQRSDRNFFLTLLLNDQRKDFVNRRKRIIQENLSSDVSEGIVKTHQELKNMISIMFFMN
jgi:Trp operon repressor